VSDLRAQTPRIAATWSEEGAGLKDPPAASSLDQIGASVLPAVEWASSPPALRLRDAPRFLVTGRLGEGGLGEVVAALDQDIGRTVAIKRIRADRGSTSTLVRFVQEIRTIGRLEHANIVPIHDVGRDEAGALYFVMRHVDGETLDAVLHRLKDGDPATHARFGIERRVEIATAVLEALAYAHARGVVHRDVKPANVMIGRYGEVMLLDWGVARLVEGPHSDALDAEGAVSGSLLETQAGALIGTPLYMSPEQARGEKVDARSDLYAVAVMMHELLTLEHYLADCEGTEAILEGVRSRPLPLGSRQTSPHQNPVPPELAWFLVDAAAKDAAQRFPNAEAMLDRLARRREGDFPVQCPVTFTHYFVRRGLRFFDRNLLACTAAAATGIIGAFVMLGLLFVG
jgi:serine/threonine-protein kinase